jgi:hypothetical protein
VSGWRCVRPSGTWLNIAAVHLAKIGRDLGAEAHLRQQIAFQVEARGDLG